MTNSLRLRGLCARNLRRIDLEFAQDRWSALCGVSGAGKSAVLEGVLLPRSRSQFALLHDATALPAPQGAGGAEADSIEGLRPLIFLAGDLPRTRRMVPLGTALGVSQLLTREALAEPQYRCPACGGEWVPAQPEARCADIHRFSGRAEKLTLLRTAGADARDPLLAAGWTRYSVHGQLQRLEDGPAVLPEAAQLLLDRVRCEGESTAWRERRYLSALQEADAACADLLVLDQDGGLLRLPHPQRCPHCASLRTSGPEDDPASSHRLHGMLLADWYLPSVEALPRADLLPQTRARLDWLVRCGLGHLALSRPLGTLSLGEARRVELAALLGAAPTGRLVLLDEPGMGISGSERLQLATLLRELAASGNTVLTADPSLELTVAADRWVQLGPGAGADGGRVVGEGHTEPPAGLFPQAKPPRSPPPTGPELRFTKLDRRSLAIPTLSLPVTQLTVLCGMSGSGKSTLLELLLERIRAGDYQGGLPEGGVRALLSRTLRAAPRSTLATLSGIAAPLRAAYADSEEGRLRGVRPTDLRPFPRYGGCPTCEGRALDRFGFPCSACHATGLRKDLLDLATGGVPLLTALTRPLDELVGILPRRLGLQEPLERLRALGLGNRRLAEPSSSLSLGERNRAVLARALHRRRFAPPTLWLLDEPCLGLPPVDAERVLTLLRERGKAGDGFWVIEHAETLIRAADHLLELGPGAGPKGGRLIHQGSYQELLLSSSPTARWLRGGGVEPTAADPRPSVAVQSLSGALPDDLALRGQSRLRAIEAAERSRNSPLLGDLPPAVEVADPRPIVRPADPSPEAPLLAVLGLDPLLIEGFRREASDRCTGCGGEAPPQTLGAFLAGLAPHAGPLLLAAPLRTATATPDSLALLQSAGFRRLLLHGELLPLDPNQPVPASAAVLLDRLEPAELADEGRLEESARQARQLADGEILVATPDGENRFQPGRCRNCEATETVPYWNGRSRAEWEALPLPPLLDALADSPGFQPFLPFVDLLREPPFLELPSGTPFGELPPLLGRALRLTGLVAAGPPSVLLLFDRPLSGLPAPWAIRLARSLLADDRFLFTDPEGWTTATHGTADAPIDLPLADLVWPTPAQRSDTLWTALGLESAFESLYCRLDLARLHGWTARDLRALPRPALHDLELEGIRWAELPYLTLANADAAFHDYAGLAPVFDAALALGLGPLPMGSAFADLPDGLARVVPLARLLAANPGDASSCSPALLTAGLNATEASRVLEALARAEVPSSPENRPAP